jgi:hypothetical protein
MHTQTHMDTYKIHKMKNESKSDGRVNLKKDKKK